MAISESLLALKGLSAREIFGTPDDLTLCSGATPFAQASPRGSVFERVLAMYFGCAPDPSTLALLRQAG